MGMARPKKPRYFNGVLLEENLYPDNKGRPGHWRYCRPDGSFRHFEAESVESANQAAAEANANRDSYRPQKPETSRSSFAFHLPYYIEEREDDDPKLRQKASWRNRKYHLQAFCREFDKPVHLTTYEDIKAWWRGLTHSQQGSRRPEFRRYFNYLMGEGLCPKLEYNPFTTADDLPKLARKGHPQKKRARFRNVEEFWKVYDEAGRLGYTGLQIAMGVSLLTSMREADICALELDKHLEGDLLKRVINKSAEQVGAQRAARLSWDIGAHDQLKKLIQMGRELSMKHGRCQFLISYAPKRKVMGDVKKHYNQMLPRMLISQFAEAREVLPIPPGRTPVTFHEVRSLFSKLAEDAGYDLTAIQQNMAHADPKTTLNYQSEHSLPYAEAPVILDETVLGRSF